MPPSTPAKPWTPPVYRNGQGEAARRALIRQGAGVGGMVGELLT
jgi:hypothetical protein